jgi:hypothetical protein
VVDTLRTDVLLVCPGCKRHVRPHVTVREYEETGVAADTSGIIASGLRVLTGAAVRCPIPSCLTSWWVGANALGG